MQNKFPLYFCKHTTDTKYLLYYNNDNFVNNKQNKKKDKSKQVMNDTIS